MDLREIPLQNNRAAWPEYLNAVREIVARPRLTLAEVALLGQLYNRLSPMRDTMSHQLQRLAEDRLRGLATATRDEELEELYDRLCVVIGSLRQFASFTNAGSPEFPVTDSHEQFAAALLVADTKARAQAKFAEEAAKPTPEWRWTANGYVRNNHEA